MSNIIKILGLWYIVAIVACIESVLGISQSNTPKVLIVWGGI